MPAAQGHTPQLAKPTLNASFRGPELAAAVAHPKPGAGQETSPARPWSPSPGIPPQPRPGGCGSPGIPPQPRPVPRPARPRDRGDGASNGGPRAGRAPSFCEPAPPLRQAAPSGKGKAAVSARTKGCRAPRKTRCGGRAGGGGQGVAASRPGRGRPPGRPWLLRALAAGLGSAGAAGRRLSLRAPPAPYRFSASRPLMRNLFLHQCRRSRARSPAAAAPCSPPRGSSRTWEVAAAQGPASPSEGGGRRPLPRQSEKSRCMPPRGWRPAGSAEPRAVSPKANRARKGREQPSPERRQLRSLPLRAGRRLRRQGAA